MTDYSGYAAILCYRWINEVTGERCVLIEGHDGVCSSVRPVVVFGKVANRD